MIISPPSPCEVAFVVLIPSQLQTVHAAFHAWGKRLLGLYFQFEYKLFMLHSKFSRVASFDFQYEYKLFTQHFTMHDGSSLHDFDFQLNTNSSSSTSTHGLLKFDFQYEYKLFKPSHLLCSQLAPLLAEAQGCAEMSRFAWLMRHACSGRVRSRVDWHERHLLQ